MSQSLGHHIANDSIRDWVFDKIGRTSRPKFESTPYDVAIIGDYNIGGDAWSSRILLEEMGLRVIAQWSGDGSARRTRSDAQGQAQPPALLPLDELHLAPHGREVRHSVVRVQLLRPDARSPSRCARSPSYFDDKIKEGAERVIAKYQPLIDAVIAKYRPRLEGKTVMLFVGGLRPRHVIGAYEDLGMEVVGTGYEFGHNDDYQRTTRTTSRTAR